MREKNRKSAGRRGEGEEGEVWTESEQRHSQRSRGEAVAASGESRPVAGTAVLMEFIKIRRQAGLAAGLR